MLILCGSLIGMMQNTRCLMTAPCMAAGLHRSGWRLCRSRMCMPLSISLLSVRWSQYAITGGVPKYLEFFNDQEGLLEQVESAVLSKNGFLYEEHKLSAER